MHIYLMANFVPVPGPFSTEITHTPGLKIPFQVSWQGHPNEPQDLIAPYLPYHTILYHTETQGNPNPLAAN